MPPLIRSAHAVPNPAFLSKTPKPMAKNRYPAITGSVLGNAALNALKRIPTASTEFVRQSLYHIHRSDTVLLQSHSLYDFDINLSTDNPPNSAEDKNTDGTGKPPPGFHLSADVPSMTDEDEAGKT
jgi:hypothetical protein